MSVLSGARPIPPWPNETPIGLRERGSEVNIASGNSRGGAGNLSQLGAQDKIHPLRHSVSSASSWRAPAGTPPQIKLVSNAILTGKRHATAMLGEYLVPPIIDFSVYSRGSDDDIEHPEYAEGYAANPPD